MSTNSYHNWIKIQINYYYVSYHTIFTEEKITNFLLHKYLITIWPNLIKINKKVFSIDIQRYKSVFIFNNWINVKIVQNFEMYVNIVFIIT